jgi:hypothetical protein
MSISIDLLLFLYFQDNLEYHYILMPQETFIGYDQTIINSVEPASLELMLSQVYPVYHHFRFDLSLCGHISNATSAFQLHSYSGCIILL